MRIRRTLVATALVALVGVVGVSGCTTKVVTSGEAGTLNTVTASGNGIASATPDQAEMTFGATAQDKDAKAALDAVSATAQKIGAAIKGAGVDEKDIQTQNVSVYPIMSPDSNQITGYQASLSVSAKVRDLATLSEVIAAASGAGSDSINGPTFGVADDTAYREDAIGKAVDDARVSAQAMAKAAGKSVGEVVQISASDASIGPVRMASEDSAAGVAANVPIEPGQLDVNASVTVVFELK